MTATKTVNQALKRCDFHFETQKGLALVTPLSHHAYEYAVVALAGVVMWGRSYLLPIKRAASLRSALAGLKNQHGDSKFRVYASTSFNKISQQ